MKQYSLVGMARLPVSGYGGWMMFLATFHPCLEKN